MNQLIKTTDGSHTIYVPELDEHYHSVHGAVQESNHIFIRNGFMAAGSNPTRILEIGFGTGLNTLLTAVANKTENRDVLYTSIEKYPVSAEIIGSLNHYEFAGENGKELFQLIHSAEWNKKVKISQKFTLEKIHADLTKTALTGFYDLIYFDAFGPDKQPEMWTREIFFRISNVTVTNGILVTYSAKGEVKRSLKSCGFNVSLLPGPPGKRQMIRAFKI